MFLLQPIKNQILIDQFRSPTIYLLGIYKIAISLYISNQGLLWISLVSLKMCCVLSFIPEIWVIGIIG